MLSAFPWLEGSPSVSFWDKWALKMNAVFTTLLFTVIKKPILSKQTADWFCLFKASTPSAHLFLLAQLLSSYQTSNNLLPFVTPNLVHHFELFFCASKKSVIVSHFSRILYPSRSTKVLLSHLIPIRWHFRQSHRMKLFTCLSSA